MKRAFVQGLLVLAAVAAGWLVAGERVDCASVQQLQQVYVAQVKSWQPLQYGQREYTLQIRALKREVSGARLLPGLVARPGTGSKVLVTFADGDPGKPLILGLSPWGEGESEGTFYGPLRLEGAYGGELYNREQLTLSGGDGKLELGKFPSEVKLEAEGSRITIDRMGNVEIYAEGMLTLDSWRDLVLKGEKLVLQPRGDLELVPGDDLVVKSDTFDCDVYDFELEGRKATFDADEFNVLGRSRFTPEPWRN